MRVRMDNVERVIPDEKGEQFLKKGYKEVAPVQPEETDISKMKVPELKALAEEKGIEGAASMKKEYLIAALKGGEADGESGEA